ncbi:UDP-N-acetylmuramoyl-L-alanyl-D-glutamate--2,6-diaminopimelate ligase [bacterium]|nr:UDP-N-acetylmuramoyl-L-alanyl-D-glutamate--2,6-diaminopimelate ligase [bacterium]
MTLRRPVPLMELIARAGLSSIDLFGNADTMVTGIGVHAQKIRRSQMFVAITGTRTDSHMMIGEAVEAGASVIVVERETMPYPGVTTVRVPNTRLALGLLAQAWHGHPARGFPVCGVTGTNGKTTTTHMVTAILRQAGMRTGLVGTLGAFFNGKSVDLGATTPSPLDLAQVFEAMEQERIDAVAMECSSHAIDQYRLAGIPIRVGALLGITQDHLDYHGTFENYVACKKRLFNEYVLPTPGSVSCFNVDDPVGRDMVASYTGDQMSFGRETEGNPDVTCENLVLGPNETTFTLRIRDERAPVASRFIGTFNVSNMLAAAACSWNLGVSINGIAEGLEKCPPVAGRFEVIDEGQPFTTVVDYAHTPDALERVMRTARRLCTGRLIVVFGCGGDRDRTKRPLMGKVAGELGDYAIVTSDNPRTEDPEQIARMAMKGVLSTRMKSNQCHMLLDRREAIEQALMLAGPGDLVLIAGKGHEDYQEIGTRRIPFDDRAVAREALGKIAARQAANPPTFDPTLEHAR